MKRRKLVVFLSILVLLLTLDSIHNHFFVQKSDLWIQVGIPISFDDAGNVSATYYGKAMTAKQETDLILLAMVNAQPIAQEQYPSGQPDAILTIGYNGAGYIYELWFLEDSVIFGNQHTSYKEFQNDHTNVVPILKNLAEFLKNIQNNA